MTHDNKTTNNSISPTLHVRPERQYIRKNGCERYIDFYIQVASAPVEEKVARPALNLAVVLDRSGSMQGEKLRIAKRATLAVLETLSGQDKIAVVVFDNQIDVIQPAALVTPSLKSSIKETLQTIEARASTALHQGWLSGCKAIAGKTKESGPARCFLLTDGLANVGLTDNEQIASEAADIRENTGISTSTFGIGQDYNELLLGPMAVAGGGQFHHLRTPDEIFNTFVGESGEMLTIAVRQVRLELKIGNHLSFDLISAYWLDRERKSIAIGDLSYDEEQHIIVKMRFPEQGNWLKQPVQARLVWLTNTGEQHTAWQEITFPYASDPTCDDELRNKDVMHWVGMHEADLARREAIGHNNRNDLKKAQAVLKEKIQLISGFAENDQDLLNDIGTLNDLEKGTRIAPLPSSVTKEQYYEQQRRTKNKKDYRQ